MAELLFLLEDLEGVAFPEPDGHLTVAFPFLWSPGFLACCVSHWERILYRMTSSANSQTLEINWRWCSGWCWQEKGLGQGQILEGCQRQFGQMQTPVTPHRPAQSCWQGSCWPTGASAPGSQSREAGGGLVCQSRAREYLFGALSKLCHQVPSPV